MFIREGDLRDRMDMIALSNESTQTSRSMSKKKEGGNRAARYKQVSRPDGNWLHSSVHASRRHLPVYPFAETLGLDWTIASPSLPLLVNTGVLSEEARIDPPRS